MTTFLILATAMLVLALGAVLVPILRHGGSARAAGTDARRIKALDDALAAGVIDRTEYASKRAALPTTHPAAAAQPRRARSTSITVLVLALVLPAAAIVLYHHNGESAALDPARLSAAGPAADAEQHGTDMTQAVAGLEAKLREEPENADGWALLGRAYQAMGRFAEARDALKRALDLSPGVADLEVEYAQALGLANDGRRIVGESRALLEKVLASDPDHQRALWLIGISDYQAGNYDAAIGAWNRLLPNLPADSDIAQSVRTQIAEAQRLGGATSPSQPPDSPPVAPAATPPVAASAPAESAADGEGPRLTLRIALDPKLAAQVPADAVLYVFARAANGPPMPLAIQRLAANRLPATITLDDSMGMLPTMKLSMFPQVVVGARISRTGNATAQSGDLQGLSGAIDSNRREPLDLLIDSVVP